MQNKFLKHLEKDFYIDFDKDDRYVLDEKGNVIELYIWGHNTLTHPCSNDPKEPNDISILLPLSPFLKVLHINDWWVEDMSPIEHFTELNELNLSNNSKIRKICGLKNLIKLKILNLGYANIEKISGLESLTKLKILNLSGNNIEKIEGLDTLLKLEALYLQDNAIRIVEKINHLINLKRLQLSHNEVKKLENTNSLINLTKLTIGNELTQFPNLSNQVLLEELGVIGNFNRTSCLNSHTQLHTIDISSDLEIENSVELMELENLKNIEINCKEIKGNILGGFYTSEEWESL